MMPEVMAVKFFLLLQKLRLMTQQMTLLLLLNRIQEQLSGLMDFKVTFIAIVVWMHLPTLFGHTRVFFSPAFCLLGSVPPVL